MTLALEIEFLAGVVFAAQGPDSAVPDWPPQPDRVFSALVATWGSRANCSDDDSEAAALRWLEEQPIPAIVASDSEARTAPLAYVPPNDPKAGRSGNIAVLPALRARHPRRFPASRPRDSVIRYYWAAASPETGIFQALERLAADTAYIGHSSSLTRCRFLRLDEAPSEASMAPRRQIYKGRFDELCRDYGQFLRSNGKTGRPRPGDPVWRAKQMETAAHSCFSPDWLVLEHTDGDMPDIRAAALVAKEIRDTLLSGYNQAGLAGTIPAEVSGHREDGSPSPEPHLAIVPLTFAGFSFADGHVLGFALVPRRGSTLLKDPTFRKALRCIAPHDDTTSRSTIRLHSVKDLKLCPTLEPCARSLDPARYIRSSSIWATVTPLVLDRHLKESGTKRQNEIEDQIRSACQNIKLPLPLQVVADRHPAIEGVPSAYPSGKAPRWMRWRLPSAVASRQLTHAVIRFAEPVNGPIMIGAGRFTGLGLCLPLD